MSFQEIIDLLKEKNASFALLLCHKNADADAICSAYAFQCLLKRFLPDLISEIGTPQGVNKPSKRLLEQLPITVNCKPNIESADVLFLMDTNTIEQLDQVSDAIKKSAAPVVIIDHHAPSPETVNTCKVCIIEEHAAATCELVYDLYRQANVKPTLNEAKAMFIGIAFDTRHFALASSATLKALGALVDSGIDAQETLAMISLPIDNSERLAKLKACKRAKIIKINDWIIALSHVSAYQASAAKSLVDLGAHMSAVAGKKEDKIEISLRCSRHFHQQAGVHLGTDIAVPLGELLGGVGGGHAMASGVSGTGEIDEALKMCLKLLKQKIVQTEGTE
ncbi:MAG: DHH family phosphoesterase [Candidatus Bathyarchaeota archaeon]|nr:DHH family phosphoesterase [Candidatus Bathyarchaeota archaeon]